MKRRLNSYSWTDDAGDLHIDIDAAIRSTGREPDAANRAAMLDAVAAMGDFYEMEFAE